MERIKVSAESKVAETTQSIAVALRKYGEVEVSAAGRDACYAMTRSVASLDALVKPLPVIQATRERRPAKSDGGEISVVILRVSKGE